MKLRFSIIEERNPLRTRSIMDLCDYLTEKMLVPRFTESRAKWDRRFMDFFTFDNSCDPLQPTGTIQFTVPPLFAGCASSLEQAIVDELGNLGIKTGPFVQEKPDGPGAGLVLRFAIVENPTVLLQPPEVNMNTTRGRVVLRDLLGYQPANLRYQFSADDVLQRITATTDEKVAACTASPVRDAQAPSGVRRSPSAASMRAVRRCLEELRLFAEWAKGHKFQRLEASANY